MKNIKSRFAPRRLHNWVERLINKKSSRIALTDETSTSIDDGLSPEAWAEALEQTLEVDPPVAWSSEVAKWVSPNDSILELGAGTGRLAKLIPAKRKVLMDFSSDLLAIAANNVPGAETLLQDIRKIPWALKDREMSVSYSVGVLEHFSDEEIVEILREQARVSDLVITLVPNASSFFYQYWKWRLEMKGKWGFAKELPKHSLLSYYNKAGLDVVLEHTADIESPLIFAKSLHLSKSATKEISQFLAACSEANQGYLLVTVGRSRRASA